MMKVVETTVSYDELVVIAESAKSSPWLVYSDIHIAQHNKCPKYCDALVGILDLVRPLCRSSLFLGDFFDRPVPNPYELAIGAKCLRLQHDDSIMVAGNHVKDRYVESDVVDVLIDILDVTVRRPSTRSVVHNERATFFVVPYDPDWIRDGAVLKQWLKDVASSRSTSVPNIVLLHGPLNGARYDNGVVSESGAILDSDCFDGYDLVLAGDFHSPQRVQRFTTPFIYVGAPMQFSFAHRFEPVIRFMWIGTKTIQLFSVPTNTLPLPDGVLTRFVTIDLDRDIDALEQIKLNRSESAWVRVNGTLNETTNFAMAGCRLSDDVKSGRIKLIDARARAKDGTGLSDDSSMPSRNNDGVSEYIDDVASLNGSSLFEAMKEFFLSSIGDESARDAAVASIDTVGV